MQTFKEIFESQNKPKPIYIALTNPNSKKYTLVSKSELEKNELAIEVYVDEKNFSIKYNDREIVYLSTHKSGAPTLVWSTGWGWESFGTTVQKKIEEMISYLKTL